MAEGVFLEVYREFNGRFEEVGRFSPAKTGGYSFSYLSSYLASDDPQPLSISLPLQDVPFSSMDYQGFFEGMVPEGRVRTELARKFRVSPSDYLGVLRHLNCECIGAILFKSPEVSLESYEPAYRHLSWEECASLADAPVREAARLTESSRLSLAGAQSKVGVYVHEGELYAPEGSAPSTHILKLPDQDHADLPANEVYCHRLARACGLDVSDCEVLFLPDGKQALLSRRYDRPLNGEMGEVDGMPRPQRLHQEDLCQASGLPTYRKYELDPFDCYPLIVKKLIRYNSSNPLRDGMAFARQVIFSYLIGNCDNHLKNYSFLLSPRWNARKLAPAYDLVCTTVLGYSREMGISVGDTREIDEMTPTDWGLFSGDMKIPEERFFREMARICERFAKHKNTIAAAVDLECGNTAASEIAGDAEERLRRLMEASGR